MSRRAGLASSLLIPWGVAALGCGSGPSPEPERAAAERPGKPHPEPCLVVRPGPDAQRFDRWEELVAAVALPGEPTCFDARGVALDPCPRELRFEAVATGDPQGAHDVVVEVADDAFTLYAGAFHPVSGGTCGWLIGQAVAEVGPWLVLSGTGDHYLYEQSQCLEAGLFTQLAVVDRQRRELVATIACEADHAPRVSARGDRLVVTGCSDGELALTAGELAACARAP